MNDPQTSSLLGNDDEYNAAVVGWISRRLQSVRIGKAEPLPRPIYMSEGDRQRELDEWKELESRWGEHQNDQEVIGRINAWISRNLPSSDPVAGPQRQKMLMTLRAVRASRRRRASGALRVEFDVEQSRRIIDFCEHEQPLRALKDAWSKRPHAVEAVFMKYVIDIAMENQYILSEAVNRVLMTEGRYRPISS